MTREEAVNRLCDIYSGEFDVRLCEEHRKPLAAQMDFYAESSKYVLSKKAKLWEALPILHSSLHRKSVV